MANEIQYSAIAQEIARISLTEASPYSSITTEIHAGDARIIPWQIIRMDFDCDYRSNCFDEIYIVLAISAGDMTYRISPYQDDLKITVNIRPKTTHGMEMVAKPILSRTYRAYIADEHVKPQEASNSPIYQNIETANRNGINYVCFKLEEMAIEYFRKMIFGTVIRQTTQEQVLKMFFSKAIESLKLPIDENLTGVSVVPADNKTKRNHIVLKDGTRLLDIPDILQNEQGGLYSSCLGFYIKEKFVYAWPLYNSKRQSDAKKLLQIYVAPTRHARMLDKTWSQDGRTISIIASNDMKMIDDTLGDLNSNGNAVRYADASKLMKGFVEVSNNKAVMNRGINNSEYVGVKVHSNQNYAPVSSDPITDNPYLEASKLAKRSGVYFVITWNRSNPTILSPDTAVEIFFDYQDNIRTVMGTLVGEMTSITLEGRGISADTHKSITTLTVFVDRNDPELVRLISSQSINNAAEIDQF